MATAVGFQGANQVYKAAPGDEEKVYDLEVFRCDDTGMESVTSCWRLSPEELEEVARTGVVWVRTLGHRVAPMLVSGEALVIIDGQPSKAEPIIPKAPKTVK